MSKYRTRDPQLTTRDPVPTTRDPVPTVAAPLPDTINGVPVIRIEPMKCAACGEIAIWRPGGKTIPNVSTREMFRWRSCAHCKRVHFIARQMTADEEARHLAPRSV